MILLAAACAVCLVVALAMGALRHQLVDDEVREIEQQLAIIDALMAAELNGVDALLRNVDTRRAEASGQLLLHSDEMLAESGGALPPIIRALTIVDAHGTAVESTIPAIVGHDRATEAAYLQAVASADTELIVSAPQSTGVDAGTIQVTRPLRDGAHRFAGLVAATIDPQRLRNIVAISHQNPTTWSAVIHESGKVVASLPPRADLSVQSPGPLSSLLSRHLESGLSQSHAIERTLSDDQQGLTVIRSLSFGRTNAVGRLVVLVRTPMATILRHWIFAAWLLTAGLMSLIALFAVWLHRLHRDELSRLALRDSVTTELAQAQEVSEQQALRLALTGKLAGIGGWSSALQGNDLLWSDEALALLGLCNDTAGGWATLRDRCVTDESRHRLDAVLSHEFQSGESFDIEVAVRHGNGRVVRLLIMGRPRLAAGAIVGFDGALKDVTRIRQAERCLVRQTERLHIAARASRIGVWEIAPKDEDCFVSDEWLAICGYSGGDFKPSRNAMERVIHPDDRPAFQVCMVRLKAGQPWDSPLECRICFGADANRWVLVHASLEARSQNSRGRRIVGTLLDITAAKTREAKLRSLDGEIRDAHRHEAIGALVAGLAHEFNNLLAVILGSSSAARDDQPPGAPAGEALDVVLEAALLGKQLVERILEFSGKQSTGRCDQNLAEIVRDAYPLIRAALPAGVSISVLGDTCPSRVHVDATSIKLLLLNLCTNAWQALQGPGGRIEIGLTRVVLSADDAAPVPVAETTAPKPGRYAHLWVRDNGCGMDAALLAQVFAPFFTTKMAGRGTGLGLSIVRSIVIDHEGTLTLNSHPGRGSTFGVYLPEIGNNAALQAATVVAPTDLAPPPALAVAAADGAWQAALPPVAKANVLFVDDNRLMLATVRRLLQRKGLMVTCCSGPTEARDLVLADPDRFDLLITDFNMPDQTGVDLCEQIRLLRPSLPVIITSGFVTQELRTQAAAAGATKVLHKQQSFNELADEALAVLATSAPAK